MPDGHINLCKLRWYVTFDLISSNFVVDISSENSRSSSCSCFKMASTPSSSRAAVRGFVLERRRLQMTLFKFEDLAGMATKLYSPQAHMMYPGCSPAAEKSPEAVFRWFRKLGGTELGISVQEVGDNMDSERLFEWSYVRLVKSGGQVVKEGKLAAVWKKNGSNFVIDVESFTHNA